VRAWWLLVLVGCGPDLDAPDRVMLGSTITGNVSEQECMQTGLDDQKSNCRTIYSQIESASVSDSSVFDVQVVSENGFSYTALALGSTTLTVVADGDTYEGTLLSAEPDEVQVYPPCRADYGTNAEVVVGFLTYNDNQFLHHDGNANPFTSSSLLPAPRNELTDHDKVRFTTPATPGMNTITSPFDASVSIPINVVDATAATHAEIDGPYIAPDTLIPMNKSIEIGGSWIELSGERACSERFPRTLRVFTPATCAFAVEGMPNQTTITVLGEDHFYLTGLAFGDCRIELTLDGTTTTAVKTFTVGP
jgi:hypothetical protein